MDLLLFVSFFYQLDGFALACGKHMRQQTRFPSNTIIVVFVEITSSNIYLAVKQENNIKRKTENV